MSVRATAFVRVCLAYLTCLAPAFAAPVVGVTPATLDRLDGGAVELSVSGLAGGEVLLRLWADADGDGIIDPEDWLFWADVVPDNAIEWSPLMAADTDPAAGAIAAQVRLFGPFGFPYTSGSFVWEAEDPADGSTSTVAFAVTETPGAQSVSGQVQDDGFAPVPGALVLLLPASEECGEEPLSTLSDAGGNWSVQVAADTACAFRLALTARPGFLFGFAAGVPVELTGAGAQGGIVLTAHAAAHAVTGVVRYADGPRAGQGIPGQSVFAESDIDGGTFAIAVTDVDGSYGLLLDDGDWGATGDDALRLAVQGAVHVEGGGTGFTVAGGPAVAPDLEAPAANAFVSGILRDALGAGRGGQAVDAGAWCSPNCAQGAAVTAPDGSFAVGLLAPDSPGTASYDLEPAVPLEGVVARGITAVLSSGDVLSGLDLEHLAPTQTIFGTFTDLAGAPLADLCLWGESYGVERYISRARSDCDGNYVLPVIDGDWQVRYKGDALLGIVRNLDETEVDEPITITIEGEDEQANWILGPFAESPVIRTVEPSAGRAGDHVVVEGSNFGDAPLVTVGGVPAIIVVERPDLGRVVVEMPPGLPVGAAEVIVTRTDVGLSSNPQCIAVEAGTAASDCTVTGTLTVGTGTSKVAGGLVVALDGATEEVARVAVSDGAGNYTLDLDSSSTYSLLFIPAPNNSRQWGSAEGVACPSVVDHGYRTGRRADGRVLDDNGVPLANVNVSAEGDASYGEIVTDENGEFTVRLSNNDLVKFRFTPPHGSRLQAAEIRDVLMDAPVTLPDTVLEPGRYFAGRIVDRDGAGVGARIEARTRADGDLGGATRASSCDGSFAVPLGPGEFTLFVEQAGSGQSEVRWVEADGDERAEFDFPVSDDADLQFAGPEPRIADDPTTRARVGQAVVMEGENLSGGAVSVLFSAGAGLGAPLPIPGDDTLADPTRGVVFTRVPIGAADGSFVVDVGGLQSAPVAFSVDPAPFDPGAFELSGAVTTGGQPVAGALVVLLTLAADPLQCDSDNDDVHDYALTDAAGAYSLNHPGGDLIVAVLPPRQDPPGGTPSLTLAPAAFEFPGESGNRVLDVDLEEGLALSMRVVSAATSDPVPGAHVSQEGDAFDFTLSDAEGLATLWVPPGPGGMADVGFELGGPVGSRLLGQELFSTAPDDLGDVSLLGGRFVSGRVIDDGGLPLAGARAHGNAGFPAFDNLFEATVAEDGLWIGSAPTATPFEVNVDSERDDVTDAHLVVDDGLYQDTILYPSLVLDPAGIVRGTVRDGSTGLPFPQVGLGTVLDTGWGPFGDTDANGQTCDDGAFAMKVPVGTHFVAAFGPFAKGGPQWFSSYYSPSSNPGDACPQDAETLEVVAGSTLLDVDIEIDPFSWISGTVSAFDGSEGGASIEVSVGRLGSCLAYASTAGDGTYFAQVPAGDGYRVEAQAPPSIGGPSQCWQSDPGCANFTPVDTQPFSTTPGIDFQFGSAPPEVSGGNTLLSVAPGQGVVTVTFEKLPPEERPDGYNVYRGTLGSFGAADVAECFLAPFTLQDNGNGTYSHAVVTVGDAEWFLVGASNPLGESSLGDGRTLANACGALP